jgi:long-chain acyl-CoA synthetase
VMIHPLSTAPEIAQYLDASKARFALGLDAFYRTLAEAVPKRSLEKILLARIPDYLSAAKKLGFWLTKGRKIPRVPADARVHWWSEAMAHEYPSAQAGGTGTHDPAAILFSGGTTGSPKGIVLSNRNFIAEGMQAAAWGGLEQGDSILAILPIFHGFGLGVCVNAALMAGGKSILVPTFDAKTTATLLRRKRPSVLVGVPTLFHALAADASLAKADLSCLRACFCGADTLPRPVKERFESLVADRGGRVRLLEGYGLTEAVTAIMAMPEQEYREGSMGIPFPDMRAKLCAPGSETEVARGEEGELCVSGPAVMLGYLDDPEATSAALRVHADGRTWLHTGDIARRDDDGFFYFVLRLQRMIKSSGFNVYPTQVEDVLYGHPAVAEACVIGVPDLAQVERVKAYVVLKEASREGAPMQEELIAHCRKQLIKWSCPREIEFRRELPKTRVGKVDYRALARDDAQKAPIGSIAA